jgi:type IV pilus assembly protein PilP
VSLKSLSSLFLYFVGGLGGLLLAVFISTKFLSKAISQTNPPAAAPTNKAPPNINTLSPTSGNAVVPSVTTTLPMTNKNAEKILLKDNIAPEPVITQSAKQLLPGIIEEYTYVGVGKRDPFLPYFKPRPKNQGVIEDGPLTRFELEQLTLRGIIWDVKRPKGMIADPTGRGYIVSKNDRIGRKNGYIADIREGEIVIVEKFDNQGRVSYQTRVLKLQKE